ncbi:MAG: hypothetical protein JWQ27_866 [Ferruginibacter sp.]|nr:hypothetical protein [Ferruginibacter sp.]
MKILTLARQTALLAIIALGFTACDKEKELTPVNSLGQTVVKLINGGPVADPGLKENAIDFISTTQTIDVADIRRDVPNETELARVMTVIVKDDTAALRRYSDAEVANGGSPIVLLNPGWYTLNIPRSGTVAPTFVGGNYSVTLNAGEIAKQISITIPNATLLDPSTKYGLAFSIVSANADGVVLNDQKTVIVTIGAKNIYDGKYELTWQNFHPTSNPGYTGGVTTVEMRTTGANKVKIYWPDAGTFANPAIISGALSYFGAQEPEYTINTATNKVTVQNAAPGATTFYTMNPTFNSYYDPIAKVIYVKWGYSYTNGNFDPAASREWTQTFRYLGPR